jgi:hypothetical protein
MARAPTQDSEATGSDATCSEGTHLEATGLDDMVMYPGKAVVFKVQERGLTPPSGERAIEAAIGKTPHTRKDTHPLDQGHGQTRYHTKN